MDKRIFWYSVIASVVASVAFSWLLEPSTRWLWNYASTSASSTLTGIQNSAFTNAALGKRDWVTVAFFLTASFLMWGFFVGSLIGLFVRLRHQEGVRRFAESVKRVRWKRMCVVGFLCIWLAFVFFQWVRASFFMYVDLQLNASFSQRLDALAPYIESMEEKRLRSAWALMKTHEDYEKINLRMEELASSAGLRLPTLLYK